MQTFLNLLIGLGLFFAATEGCACSCALDSAASDRDRVARYFQSSDLVGVFEVVGRKRTAVFGGTRFALLQPKHIFKGAVVEPQILQAELGGTNTSCEVNVRKGELILVYSYGTEPIELTFCGWSRKLTNALRDLRYLFEITEPEIRD